MKLIYCLTILLCPYLSFAQAKKATSLSIGESMTPILCNNVLNHPSNVIDLSKFEGKVVILDFMLTSCSSCIQHLGEYDSLQRAYPGQLQVIMITPQKKEVAKVFLQKNRVGKKMIIPVIAEDTRLKALFPHRYYTHNVWIGPDNRVKAITSGEYVTAENIKFILEGKINHWPVKKDVADFDFDIPLVQVSEQIKDIIKVNPISPVLLPYLPGVYSYYKMQKDEERHSINRVFINLPITEIYLKVVGKNGFPHSCTLLQVGNRDRFIFEEGRFKKAEWDEFNTYCFQSFLPDSMSLVEQEEKIFKDLNYLFGIKASFKQRVLPSLVISKKLDQNTVPVIQKDSMMLWDIVNLLNMQYSGIPVFLADPKTERIKIPINASQVKQPDVLERILKESGFDIIKENRKMDVLIIEDKINSPSSNQLL